MYRLHIFIIEYHDHYYGALMLKYNTLTYTYNDERYWINNILYLFIRGYNPTIITDTYLLKIKMKNKDHSYYRLTFDL